MIIEKKISKGYFQPVCDNLKTFEIRREDDCKYHVGDTLHLREWDNGNYTGRECFRVITYIMHIGFDHDCNKIVVLAIKEVEQ